MVGIAFVGRNHSGAKEIDVLKCTNDRRELRKRWQFEFWDTTARPTPIAVLAIKSCLWRHSHTFHWFV